MLSCAEQEDPYVFPARARRRGRPGRDQRRRPRRAARPYRTPALDRHSRRGAVPAPHRLQRHLRDHRRGDPAVRGRLDRPVDRPIDRIADQRSRRPGPSFLAPLAVAATAWGLALFFTAGGGWRCPRSCFCSPSSAECLRPPPSCSVQIIGTGPVRQQQRDARRDRCGGQRRGRRRRRLAALAPVPRADHRRRGRGCRRRACSSALVVGIVQPTMAKQRQEPDPRLRAPARRRHVPVRDVVGLRRTARGSPAAPTSPSGFTCLRRR